MSVEQDQEMSSPVDEPNQEMDVDTQKKDRRYLPYYGTTRYINTVEPTVASAKTIPQLFDEYKQFSVLKKKDEMASNPEAGSPGYLVNINWMNSYMNFILFSQFKNDVSENNLKVDLATHFTQNHPGIINNDQVLNEEDKDNQNLYGTGLVKGLEQDYIDNYVDYNRNFNKDFVVVNDDIWKWLFERYGGQQIVRKYVRQSQYGSWMQVESKLFQVSCRLLNTQELETGNVDEKTFQQWWTQISKNESIKGLKKRILDVLTASGFKLDESDIRLWVHNSEENQEDSSLPQRCKAVQEGFKTAVEEDGNSKEMNSGVEFPGSCLDYMIKSSIRLNELNFAGKSSICVEFRPTKEQRFAFQYDGSTELKIGICEWCNNKNILKSQCKCKKVAYCNDTCLEKDLRFHEDKCAANADAELETAGNSGFTEQSRRGRTGLNNLGNTCYMNSSIQCLANTHELTQYFLENKYKSLVRDSYKNIMGTEGRMVQAYAKLLSEMQYGVTSSVRPDLFKRILGQFNTVFEGYGQHDSQECINTVLDFIHEDLYRKEKKPYVENSEADGRTDEEASIEAWNKHVYRNESIILDLFHGQYKSQINCNQCDRISIVFDPFLMVQVPIPSVRWCSIICHFIQYDMNTDVYSNWKVEAKIKDDATLEDFRKQVETNYEFPAGSFLISHVNDMILTKIYNSKTLVRDSLNLNGGVVLLHQIPASLEPKLLPLGTIKNDDSNYGIDAEWTKIVLHFHRGMQGTSNLPRVFWAKKTWTLKELHVQFFHHMKDLMRRWLQEIKQEGSSNKCNSNLPYQHNNEPLTFDTFESLELQDQFNCFFPNLTQENWKELLSNRNFSLKDMPYQLKIQNNSGYSQDCHFCNQRNCIKHCPVPFTDQQTILDMLQKVGVEDNTSYYGHNGPKGNRDFILNIVWHQDFTKYLDKHLSASNKVEKKAEVPDNQPNKKLDLDDCFNEFKKSEILDENNMWYCNKCKEHVQAQKKLEIYKAPPIMIVNLKRFKQGKQRFVMFGGGSMGSKNDEEVEFPINGFDLSKHVLGSYTSKDNMIYDCYAVSNHFGGMGGGHYTAYAKSGDKWYEFDDSRVQRVPDEQVSTTVVSSAAYNIFYRRRDWHENNIQNGVDYDQLEEKPDLSFLEKDKK